MSAPEPSVPAWWYPRPPSAAELALHPASHHTCVGEHGAHAYVWRYLQLIAPEPRAWFCDPAHVHCDAGVEFGSGTELSAYWSYRWIWKSAHTGRCIASALVTSYFALANSYLWVDDGTDAVVSPDDVPAMAAMWTRAIDRHRA
jgi:hypothetical protein